MAACQSHFWKATSAFFIKSNVQVLHQALSQDFEEHQPRRSALCARRHVPSVATRALLSEGGAGVGVRDDLWLIFSPEVDGANSNGLAGCVKQAVSLCGFFKCPGASPGHCHCDLRSWWGG